MANWPPLHFYFDQSKRNTEVILCSRVHANHTNYNYLEFTPLKLVHMKLKWRRVKNQSLCFVATVLSMCHEEPSTITGDNFSISALRSGVKLKYLMKHWTLSPQCLDLIADLAHVLLLIPQTVLSQN